MQKFERICPKCGLSRPDALFNWANGDPTVEALFTGCPLCNPVFEAFVERISKNRAGERLNPEAIAFQKLEEEKNNE